MENKNLQQNIPKGWEEVVMNDICELMTNGFVGRAIDNYTEKPDGVTYIQGYNVTSTGFNMNGVKKVTPEFSKKNSKSILRENDLLIVQTGEVGLTTIVPPELVGSNCHALIITRLKKQIASPQFILQYFRSPEGKRQIRRIKTGSTMEHVNVGDLKKVKLLLPDISEQNKISHVLSVWDQAIEKLKGKIEIKKAAKKGLMQELLTGKKRLHGFSSDWHNQEIGNMLSYEQPSSYIVSDTNYLTKGTPVLTAGKTFILGFTNEMVGIYDKGEVIIFDDFTTASKFVDFDFKVKSSAIKLLTAKNKNYNLRFVYEKMQMIRVEIGEHKRRYLSEYQYIPVLVPPKDEQDAIVSVLKSADDDLGYLRKKLHLLRDQKKYLLNKLLTGEIRTPETLSIPK